MHCGVVDTPAACMAHARRKFEEALEAGELLASQALDLFSLLYRIEAEIPRHAIELASVYLDRNVATVLAHTDVTANPQQKQDTAAFIHLCGAGPATAFVRRNFQMIAGERCGDHLVAAYVARINAMKRKFLRLAADGGN